MRSTLFSLALVFSASLSVSAAPITPQALDPVAHAQAAPLFRDLMKPASEIHSERLTPPVTPWWPLRPAVLSTPTPEPSSLPSSMPTATPMPVVTPIATPTPVPTVAPYVPGKVRLPKLSAQTLLKVSKRQQRLFVTDKGKTLASFPVSTGKSERDTPNGVFRILTKVAHPSYSGSPHLGKRYYPPKHPQNPLGSRWMQINAWHYYSRAMLGIHGTDEPQNIGFAVSGGCIRMFNADVERLYEALPLGARVQIVKD